MSNSLSIAVVTEAFRQLLDDAAGTSGVLGATATAVRPTSGANNGQPGNPPTTGANLFLYQVMPNAAFRSMDTPTRRSDGSLIQPTRSAYDLNYLLTFYGNEAQYEPQRVLGSVVRALHAVPVITRKRLENVKKIVSLPFQNANVEVETETIKLTILPLSLEELSKLWSVFFQTTYNLSLAFQASVVIIDGVEVAAPALPVASRNVYVRSLYHPRIDQVLVQKTPTDPIEANQPIVAGDILVLQGEGLRGDVTRVSLHGLEVVPDAVSQNQIKVSLQSPPFPADALRAGVTGVQVIHRIEMGTPETPHSGVESNIAALVLRPQVKVSVGAVTVLSSQVVDGVTHHDATIALTLNPKVGLDQRLVLLLNEYDPLSGRSPRAYRFDIKWPPSPTPPLPMPPDPTADVTAHVTAVAAGTYLLRVQVDGAESLLYPGTDPNAPKYTDPRVTI